MLERTMRAFEEWMKAKEELGSLVYPFASPESICDAEIRMAEAREAYMRAMDAWFEWKRLHGPEHPGR